MKMAVYARVANYAIGLLLSLVMVSANPQLATPVIDHGMARTANASVLEEFVKLHGVSDFEETYREWLVGLSWMYPELFGSEAGRISTGERLVAALERGHPDLVAELRAMSRVFLRYKNSSVFELPMLASATAVYVIGNISPKNTTDTKPHLTSACTSTLVIDPSGNTLHGRSLDYDPRDPMARTLVQMDFPDEKSSQSGYSCFHPLVYPIALQWFTCIRPGEFSLSVNARSQGRWNEHNTTFEELLRRLEDPATLLLGEVAQAAMQHQHFNTALAFLATSRVLSSNYFILAGAGAGEGAVVTRYGNNSAADVWALGSGGSDGQPSWMRVQTNVDHWVAFGTGAYATYLRQHAINLLKGLGEGNVTGKHLWDVYTTASALDNSAVRRTSPEDTGAILRPSTIASFVFSPSSGVLNSCVWETSAHLAPPATPGSPKQRLPKCARPRIELAKHQLGNDGSLLSI